MSVAFSYLNLFVVLTVLFDSVAHAAFSFRPPNSTCVWTERQLRKVIGKATNQTRTRITLCRQMIAISMRNSDTSTGIDLTDRFVDIRCYLKRSKGMCKLDGGYSSRIFYGERADLTVGNVLFTNAKPDACDEGGAINLAYSDLSLTGCSFNKNGDGCSLGGAIHVSQSTLKINGGSKRRPVLFSENKGNDGAALFAYRSQVSIDGFTVFFNNSADFYGVVIVSYSIFNIKNAKFQENFGSIGSGLSSYDSQSTLDNVEFIGNDGGISVNRFIGSSVLATNCIFANNNGTVIHALQVKITLKNSTFSNNTSIEDTSNIYIEDDINPLNDGTFVYCKSNVVFCNGLDKTSILEFSLKNTTGNFNNTDCITKGLQGTPGQGSCPI